MSQTTDLVVDGSGAMFDRIAARYDFVNRVLSLGIDRRWRARAARAVGGAHRVLDLATGTGDLAFAILSRSPDVEVVGLDPSREMLRRAEEKAGNERRFRAVLGTAEVLPFPDRSFDAVTIAFGIRNVPDRARALREMRRVLVPGGRAIVLELTEPGRGALSRLAHFHTHRVVPLLGALLSGAHEYRYLSRSIAVFPPVDEVAAMMADAGLRPVSIERLTLGVCTLFVAEAV